ncbi:hypothetical protein V8C86DRAFT_2520336 [Haematococcus lacustris]
MVGTHWDVIVGSDLIYNHVGSLLLPHVIHRLASPDTLVLYAHTKHRFDHLDLEFMEAVAALGMRLEEVREPWLDAPPASPPPLTQLFPEMRVAVYRIWKGNEPT